ncbi:unnamed protein product, partial [Brassica rapa subsp. narinosa]
VECVTVWPGTEDGVPYLLGLRTVVAFRGETNSLFYSRLRTRNWPQL